MENDEKIRLEIICSSYNAEDAFIDALMDAGLIRIIMVEDTKFVEADTINDLERMIRLHYDMGINLEGIETVVNLLEKIQHLQEEMNALKNRLRVYEID